MSERRKSNKNVSPFQSVELIPIYHLGIQHDNEENHSDQTVSESVALYEYDDNALPLMVFPDPENSGFYIVVDGVKRLRGARRNLKIRQLRCIVINAKNIKDARLIVAAFNDPIHDIRERKTLAYYLLWTLNKIYTGRPLTKNLSLTKPELENLARLAGESESTCNKALAIFRKVFKSIYVKNPNCASSGLECFFTEIIESGRFPELTQFYKFGTPVKRFVDEYKRRVENIEIAIQTPKAEKDSAPEEIKETHNDAPEETKEIQTETPKEKDYSDATISEPEIKFLTHLKSAAANKKFPQNLMSEIADFFGQYPDTKNWLRTIIPFLHKHLNSEKNSRTNTGDRAPRRTPLLENEI